MHMVKEKVTRQLEGVVSQCTRSTKGNETIANNHLLFDSQTLGSKTVYQRVEFAWTVNAACEFGWACVPTNLD
jgi:hypothetical protein